MDVGADCWHRLFRRWVPLPSIPAMAIYEADVTMRQRRLRLSAGNKMCDDSSAGSPEDL